MASCKLLAWLIGFEMLKLLFPKICRPNSVVVALSRLECRPNSCLELFQMVGFHPTFSRHGRIDVNIILLIWLNENVGLRYVSYHHEYLARLKFSAAKILHIIITVFAPSNFNFWCANTSANCYAAQIIWSISKTFLHISLICSRRIRFFLCIKHLSDCCFEQLKCADAQGTSLPFFPLMHCKGNTFFWNMQENQYFFRYE